MRNTRSRSSRGFTLAEVLTAVAVLAVLLALAIPAVVSYQRDLKLTELDSYAQTIFTAAQNRLTALRAAGTLEDALSDEKKMSEPPSDFPSSGLTWDDDDDDYYYVTEKNADALLPLGSIDDTLRTGGHYVIEYNKATAMVYGVFYAEDEFTYESSLPRSERETRKEHSPMLGYYGGAGVSHAAVGACPLPQFEIINGDTLYVKLTPFDLVNLKMSSVDYTITVEALDGSGEKSFQFQYPETMSFSGEYRNYLQYVSTEQGASGYYTLLLDSLDAGQFKNLYSGMTPGADLRVTVTVSGTDTDGKQLLPASSSALTNSLFAAVDDGTAADGNTNTALISCGRHLQNLSTSFSGVTSTVNKATQTNDITWTSDHNFQPITNENLTRLDGGGNVICGLDAPLLDVWGTEVNENTTEATGGYAITAENLHLESTINNSTNETVLTKNDATTAYGILANTNYGTIQNCIVAYSGDGDTTPSITVTGGSAAGFVGANYGVIKTSYSNAAVTGDSAAGFAVNNAGSITDCYALLKVTGKDRAAGFVLEQSGGACTRCYCALETLCGTNTYSTYSFTTNGGTTDCYYYSLTPSTGNNDGGAKTYAELGALVATGGAWSSSAAWTTATPARTHAISNELAPAYPFPMLKTLAHYGDWPTVKATGIPTGIVYYEEYQKGGVTSYGFAGLENGVYVSSLQGNDYDIENAGYGYLSTDGTNPNAYAYTFGGTPCSSPFSITAIKKIEGGTLYPFTESAFELLCSNLPTGQCVLTIEQRRIEEHNPSWGKVLATFYCNPFFAGAIVSDSAKSTLGTESFPLQFRTQSQLESVKRNSGNVVYIKQTHNITVSKWTPITPDMGYGCVIDGGGNLITNLSAPLFNLINYGITVQNMHVADANITIGDETETSGIFVNTNNGTIDLCIVAHSGKSDGSVPRITSANDVGGFVGSNKGTIKNCYANAIVKGDNAAGFARKSGGIISNCYALIDVSSSNGNAVGFVMSNEEGATIQNCYAAMKSISGKDTYGFGKKNDKAHFTDCFYYVEETPNGLAKKENQAGTQKTYAGLAELVATDGAWSNSAAWTTATSARTHAISDELQGTAYPFPMLAGLDHYGDWPNKLNTVEMAYYEVYTTATSISNTSNFNIAFYNEKLGLTDLAPNGATIVQDGYALLFAEDSDNSNTSGGIAFDYLGNSSYISCTWGSTTDKTDKNYLKSAKDFTYNGKNNVINVSYGGEILDTNSTITVEGHAYLPRFLSAKMCAEAAPAGEDFYQFFTVTTKDGATRTFWYNPHFAKSAIYKDEKPDSPTDLAVSIRTERQFATLATSANSAYWINSALTFQQERDLDLGDHNPYTTSYFDGDMTKTYPNYRSTVNVIGSAANTAFRATYDGKKHTLSNLSYTTNSGNLGVFGFLTGTVKDLTLENITVNSSADQQAFGGLAGNLTGTGSVENVTLKNVAVSGNRLVGGAIGRLSGGTVEGLTVQNVNVTAGRLAGGAFGQIIADSAVTISDVKVCFDDTVGKPDPKQTQNQVTSRGKVKITQDYIHYGFGTGGFAGACVQLASNLVSISNITVGNTNVTVEQMTNDTSGGSNYHGGAAFIGNYYNSSSNTLTLKNGDKIVDGKTVSNGVTLENCTVTAQGADSGTSAYGLFFGRLRSVSSAVDLSSATLQLNDSNSIKWEGGESSGGVAVGGYIGAVTAFNGSATRTLTVTLPDSLAAVALDVDDCDGSVGGFVGEVGENVVLNHKESQTTLKGNVSITGGSGSVGGFVGKSAGILSGCSVSSSVEISGSGSVGGFAGQITGGEISSCDVRLESAGTTAKVTGNGSVGGFVGSLSGSTAVAKSCFAAIPVAGTGAASTGGFAGTVLGGRVESCYAANLVSAGGTENSATGGFVGRTGKAADDNTIPLITNCYASGNVNVDAETGYTGGFVGYSEAGSILSCYSAGTVTVNDNSGKENWTGGFIGGADDLVNESDPKATDAKILEKMVTFYNVLQTTKVVNRADSYGTNPEFNDSGDLVSINSANCKSVIDYLTSSSIQIDSTVAGDNLCGEWTKNDDGTWTLKKDGAVSWNVKRTMTGNSLLSDGVWMATNESGKGIVVYWFNGTTEDLKAAFSKSQPVTVYRYVSSEQKYSKGTITVGKSNQYGTTYYTLARGTFIKTSSADMPATMTINGVYRYVPNGDNSAYADYNYVGVDRKEESWFEGDGALAFPGMGKSGDAYPYPYPALENCGCGCGVTGYVHHGVWWGNSYNVRRRRYEHP